MATPATDDDDISLCSSTWTEYQTEYDDTAPYTIDRILAEREDEGESLSYLLSWQGYGEERATWEVEDNVPNDTIQVWKERKDRINARLEEQFDVEHWLRNTRSILEGKFARKQRRDAKRRRLGILTKYRREQPLQPPDVSHPAGVGSSAMTVDAPLFEPEGGDNHLHSFREMPQAPSAPTTIQPSQNKPGTVSLTDRSRPALTKATKPTAAPPLPAATNLSQSHAVRRPANIFAEKWNDQTRRKRRAPVPSKANADEDDDNNPKPRKALTLSHLNKINKASVSDRPPSLAFEELQKVYKSRPPAPMTNVQPSEISPAVATSSTRLAPSTVLNLERGESNTDPVYNPPSEPQAPTGPRRPTGIKSSRKQKTCIFWFNGKCKKNEQECSFAHRVLEEFSIPPNWDGLPPRGWPGAPLPPTTMSPTSTVVKDATKPASSSKTECITVSFGIPVSNDVVNVQLLPDHRSIAALLEATCGKNPQLDVAFTITNKIYKVFHSSEPLQAVNIHFGRICLSEDDQPLALKYQDALRAQAELMGASAAASVIAYKEWAMILYFVSDAQTFGDGALGDPVDVGAQLRFQIISPRPSPHNPPTVTVPNSDGQSVQELFVSYIYRVFAGIHDSDFDQMFGWFDGKKLDKHVFLRFEGHPHERDVLVSLISHLVSSVTTSDEPGAWRSFVDRILPMQEHDARGSGVVIFHPANHRFDNVPDLWKLTLSSVNFYVFGPCTNDPSPLNRYDTIETPQLWKMWQTGTVTMVSDELLTHHPRRAQKVVDHIVRRGARRPFKDRTWKLYTRPNVIGWLRDTALAARAAAPLGTWREWSELANTINDNLCPEGYFAPGCNDPLPEATLISGPSAYYERLLRSFKASGKRSDEEAKIMCFADWTTERVFEFRRFCVVVPEVTPEYAMLQERYQHIQIRTPEKYLERFSR